MNDQMNLFGMNAIHGKPSMPENWTPEKEVLFQEWKGHDELAERILNFMADITARFPGARFAAVVATTRTPVRVCCCPFNLIDVWEAMSEQFECSFLGALVFNADGNLLAVPVQDNRVIYEMMTEAAKLFFEDTSVN